MNNHITLRRFTEAGLQFETLELDAGFSILCTARGGRMLGPFEDDDSESLTWLNPAFASKERFAQFLSDGDWNMGGDRMWCLPEMPFFVKERKNFFDTYVVRKELDTGSYTLNSDRKSIVMGQSVKLNTFEAC